MRCAKIGAEIRPFHSPPGDSLDAKRKLQRAFLFSGHVFMHPGVTLPSQAALKLGDRKREKRSDIGHGFDCMPLWGRVNPESLYSPDGQNPHDLGMDDIWPQRVVSRNHLEDFHVDRARTSDFFLNFPLRCAPWGHTLSLHHPQRLGNGVDL